MNPKKKNALMVVLRNKTVFADATLLCIFSLSKTGEPKIIMFSMTWRQLIEGFDLSVFRNKPEGKNLTGALMLF